MVKKNAKKNEPATGGTLSDEPLKRGEYDDLNRTEFAKHVGDLIASQSDDSSVVIGIYGTWGEGKTTLVNFIGEHLQASHDEAVIPVWFNPWRFPDEGRLLESFFKTLGEELGRSLTGQKEAIGGFLAKYASAMIPSVGIGPIHLSMSDAAKAIGEALSTVELEELKKRLKPRSP